MLYFNVLLRMKLAVFSDLQADTGAAMCFNQPSMPLQLFRVQKFHVELLRIFKEQRCDALVCLGDATDNRSSLAHPVIDSVLAGLEPFPNHEFNLKLIGNHEQYVRSGDVHVGRLFAHKYTVVSQCESFELHDDTVVVCVAYPPNDETASRWIKGKLAECRNYRRKILFGHFQVAGCSMASGTAVHGVSPRLLQDFDLVLLGHVHRPQALSDKIFYVGSPFQQDFGEKDEVKRVAVLDTRTLELTWIPLPGFPEYLVVDFKTFCGLVRAEDEHRYQVTLQTSSEAEEFYTHPLMSRGEPIYDFHLSKETTEAQTATHTWSMESAMERFVNETKSDGIEISPADLLAYGKALAKGEG